jgi:hypothetical protein
VVKNGQLNGNGKNAVINFKRMPYYSSTGTDEIKIYQPRQTNPQFRFT